MPLSLELNPSPGDDVCETASEMLNIACRLGVPVRIRFNDVLLRTNGRDRASQIVADYERWMSGPAGSIPRDPGA